MINLNFSTKTSHKYIFFTSIPIFFSNLAIPLVGVVDTGLMGNLGETKYLASLSISTSIMTMIVMSFGFLRMGTVGLVAQLFAKSDYREISRTLIRNFLIAIIISIIIIILKPFLLSFINNFFKTSTETQSLIKTYISIRILSIPAELIIFIIIGFYLGLQKTKISSLVVISLSALNIVLSAFFVLSLNLDVFGVAMGTLIAAYITATVFSIFTYKFIIKNFQIIPNYQRLMNASKYLKLITINFDIFIRSIFLSSSFIIITYLGAKLGEDYLAVNTILMQFIILTSFFLDAYAFSTEGIAGYTYGKKNKKSFQLVVRNSLQLSFFTSIIISIFYLFFFKNIINLITDVEILRYISYSYAIWIIIIPPIASFCYQLDGIFIGTSQTKEIRNAMIISVIFFIFLSTNLVKYIGNHGIWLSLLLFMVARSLTLNVYFKSLLKKF